jgi:hypothetical protein
VAALLSESDCSNSDFAIAKWISLVLWLLASLTGSDAAAKHYCAGKTES